MTAEGSTPPFVSVVLCAHNPRPHHLQPTLDSLRAQDLSLPEWELILIDNRSDVPVASRVDLSWHPQAQTVVEPTLGLAHARVRGYRESRGALVIHCDDDNILAPDYLRVARRICCDYPHIGTYGGQLRPQFDVPPKNELERSFGGEVQLDEDRWSNLFDDHRTMPFGAGMCLRRDVITAYLEEVARDPRRLILGRAGDRFITGEDIDLNYIAVRRGFGTGRFRALQLAHLIPAERMTATHFIRYQAGNAYSMVILRFLHLGEVRQNESSAVDRLRVWLRLWLRMTPHERRLEIALRRARSDALRDLRAWGWLK
jgi:glycosyltransferase involved in cell wall biosynthesis